MRAALYLLLVVPGTMRAQESCGDRAWRSIGVGAYHCPGGTCRFIAPRGPESAGFAFSTEPWLRAIEPDGPAAGRIEEGDVLVAVNGFLITTGAGAAELAQLDAGREAVLTMRRGVRLHEIRLRPRSACAAPLMLVGNTVLGAAREPAAEVDAGADPILVFDAPRRLGPTAVDAGLGLTLRCPGCELLLREGETRWSVPSWPTVDRVERGGVAEEAGLRPGDEIRRIAGRDVRSASGTSPLFSPPRGDFTIEYARDGARRSAFMNRRIVDRRIIIRERGIRIVRSEEGWSEKLLGALARWWRELAGTERSAGGATGRLLARGESWGPASLGVLFRGAGDALFSIESVDGRPALRFPAPPIVAEVTPGGAGARAGLAAGDAVTHVDGRSVLEPAGARLLLFPREREPLELTYLRDGRVLRATLVPSEER